MPDAGGESIATMEIASEPVVVEQIPESNISLPAFQETRFQPAENQTAIAEATSTKIVYSVGDVARFKRKPKPTPVDTARSAFQRVIDVAYDIKNENTWLGDFRQLKDELLSRPGNGPARDK
jgi:hypothetical protein